VADGSDRRDSPVMSTTHPQLPTWDAVDRALEQWLAPQDEALRAVTASAAIMVAAGRISPNAARSAGHAAGTSAASVRMLALIGSPATRTR